MVELRYATLSLRQVNVAYPEWLKVVDIESVMLMGSSWCCGYLVRHTVHVIFGVCRRVSTGTSTRRRPCCAGIDGGAVARERVVRVAER